MATYRILTLDGDERVALTFDAMIGSVRGPIPVKRGGKWGFIERDGRTLLEPTYDEARVFTGDLGPVRKGKLWGFVARSGDIAIRPQFDSAQPFVGGLAAVAKGGKWGFVEPSGHLRIDFAFDGVTYFEDGCAGINVGGKTFNDIVTLGGKWGIIDATGKVVLRPKYDTLQGFRCGVAPVSKSGKSGYHAYVGTDGKEVWKAPQGTTLSQFSEDRAWTRSGTELYRLLSRTFEWVTEGRYGGVHVFSEGCCAVNVGGAFRDGEVVGGAWGYCDDRGEIRVEPRWSLALGHVHGLASVKHGGRWGMVDLRGKVVAALEHRDAFALSPDGIMVAA